MSPKGLDVRKLIRRLILWAAHGLAGETPRNEFVQATQEPIAVKAIQLVAVPMPVGAGVRIDFLDLQDLALAHEPDSIVVTEGIGRAGDKAVQFDLIEQEVLEGRPQVVPWRLPLT